VPMPPYWQKFKGTVRPKEGSGGDAYEVIESCRRVSSTSILIDELPVGVWTETYKIFLESLVKGVKSVENMSSEEDVHFTVFFDSSEAADEAFGAVDEDHKALKLTRTIYDRNLNAFDPTGALRTYESAEAILRDFYKVRLKAYVDRKQNMLDAYATELEALEQKYDFIRAMVEGKLAIHMRPREMVLEDMIGVVQPVLTKEKAVALLRLPLSSMTEENMLECSRQMEIKRGQLRGLENTSPKELWSIDLDNIEKCII
jgi:DNA topoisomerase-2